MADVEMQAAVEAFLFREAWLLDEKRWQGWLDLFDEQAEFWTPTWKDDGEPAGDPATELSLIYCSSRAQIKERVDRVSGGRSIASNPPLRTAHIVSNVLITSAAPGGNVEVSCVGATHFFNVKKRDHDVVFALKEYTLAPDGESGFRILRKKALLLNDYISRMLDFYML